MSTRNLYLTILFSLIFLFVIPSYLPFLRGSQIVIIRLSLVFIAICGLYYLGKTNSMNHKANSADKELINEEVSDSSKVKGDLFEQYVVEKFAEESRFVLNDWRGDKYVNGIYARSSMNPDLEYEFRHGNFRKVFSVECKYRTSITGNYYSMGKEKYFRYRRFQIERRIPVYVCLGVAGTPKSPQEMYLIPLNDFYKGFIHCSKLKKYFRSPEKKFFYDMKAKVLK